MHDIKPLPIDTACLVCDMVCDFLIECGGSYKRVTPSLQEKILVCLASRQFIIKVRDGQVKQFACWFRINEDDVDDVVNRILPLDVFTGNIVYVSEIGNMEGKRGMCEIAQRMRKMNPDAKEVFWHRPVKGDKVFHFKVRGNGYGR